MSSGQSTPGIYEVHISASLTNFMVQLMAGGPYIINEAWPIIPVKKESDKYFIDTDREYLNPKGADTFRAPGMVAQNFDYHVEEGSYECVEHALKRPVPDRVRENADDPLKGDLDAVNKMCRRINLTFEFEFHNSAFTIANYAAAQIVVATAPWSNTVTSTPEQDIDLAKLAVAEGSGVSATDMIIPEHIYRELKVHPDVVQYMTAHNSAVNRLQTGQLPQYLFGLKVHVPGVLYDAANPCQDADITQMYDDCAVVVFYRDPNPGLQTATWGAQFRHIRNGEGPCRVRTWRNEPAEASVVEVSVLSHPKITNAAGAAIITGLCDTGTS